LYEGLGESGDRERAAHQVDARRGDREEGRGGKPSADMAKWGRRVYISRYLGRFLILFL